MLFLEEEVSAKFQLHVQHEIGKSEVYFNLIVHECLVPILIPSSIPGHPYPDYGSRIIFACLYPLKLSPAHTIPILHYPCLFGRSPAFQSLRDAGRSRLHGPTCRCPAYSSTPPHCLSLLR